MNWLGRLKYFWRNIKNPSELILKLFGSPETASGVSVTTATSLSVSAVYASVRVLSESIASLPLILYRRQASGGRIRARRHRLFSLLHDAPNPEMTSFEWRETQMVHLLLRGNAYSEIERDNGGRVKALWPLNPDKTKPKRIDGEIVYVIDLPQGGQAMLPFDDMLHVKGIGSTGLVGWDPLTVAQETFGLSIAAQEYGARFFANDATPGGHLVHPGKLSDEAHARLKKSWEKSHKGLTQKHRIAVLEEGMSYKAVGLRPDQAQFIETRKFQVAEIARIFRIPPHMIGDLERATFSNVEQQALDFVVHSLRPWLVRWEQAVLMKLLSMRERMELFAEFLVDGLLRGNVKDRFESYGVGRQWGWLSANDVRRIENQNPLPEDVGDVYLSPSNMVPAQLAEIVALQQAGKQPEAGQKKLRVEIQYENGNKESHS